MFEKTKINEKEEGIGPLKIFFGLSSLFGEFATKLQLLLVPSKENVQESSQI